MTTSNHVLPLGPNNWLQTLHGQVGYIRTRTAAAKDGDPQNVAILCESYLQKLAEHTRAAVSIIQLSLFPQF
jgi:hypothetical protein